MPDLSQSYGVLGELKHPKIYGAIERTVKSCWKNGIYCGTPGYDAKHTKELLNVDVKFITAVGDFGILFRGLHDAVSTYGELGFTFMSGTCAAI